MSRVKRAIATECKSISSKCRVHGDGPGPARKIRDAIDVSWTAGRRDEQIAADGICRETCGMCYQSDRSYNRAVGGIELDHISPVSGNLAGQIEPAVFAE